MRPFLELNDSLSTVRMYHRKSSGFSIELNSRKHLNHVNLSKEAHEVVYIEGDLGCLKNVSLFEEKVLVVKGHYGTLRVELTPGDLSFLNKGNEVKCP